MGDRVVQAPPPGVLHQAHGSCPTGLQALVQAFLVDGLALQFLTPTGRRRLTVQPLLEIVHQQRLDVGGVAVDLLVVGRAAECHQRPGHDVDEAPDELLEGGGLTFGRQLSGDARSHLGDAREAPHRVVSGRDLRVPEVEHEESVAPPCPLGLGVDAAQQVGVTLGVKHDHHFATADVLGDQQFGQPGLAHAGGAEHQGVAHTLGQVHPDVGFCGLNPVQRRVAAQAGGCRSRDAEPFSSPPKQARRQQALFRWEASLGQALRVALVPPEAIAQVQPVHGPGDLQRGHLEALQAAQVASVAQYPPGTSAAPSDMAEQPSSEHQMPGGRDQQHIRHAHGQGRSSGRGQSRRRLVGRPQASFEPAAHADACLSRAALTAGRTSARR